MLILLTLFIIIGFIVIMIFEYKMDKEERDSTHNKDKYDWHDDQN